MKTDRQYSVMCRIKLNKTTKTINPERLCRETLDRCFKLSITVVPPSPGPGVVCARISSTLKGVGKPPLAPNRSPYLIGRLQRLPWKRCQSP